MKIDLSPADIQYIIDLLFEDAKRWDDMALYSGDSPVGLNLLYVHPDTSKGWAEHFREVAKDIMHQTSK